jgi:hypothetical protein
MKVAPKYILNVWPTSTDVREVPTTLKTAPVVKERSATVWKERETWESQIYDLQ